MQCQKTTNTVSIFGTSSTTTDAVTNQLSVLPPMRLLFLPIPHLSNPSNSDTHPTTTTGATLPVRTKKSVPYQDSKGFKIIFKGLDKYEIRMEEDQEMIKKISIIIRTNN